MQSVVLLMVAAVWLAVILPPILRSRSQSRSNSMQDFRRQLHQLQRSVPTRTMVPARAMGRPLTQAPRYQGGQYSPAQARQGQRLGLGQAQRSGQGLGQGQRPAQGGQAHQRTAMRVHGGQHGSQHSAHSGSLHGEVRRAPEAPGVRHHREHAVEQAPHRQMHLHRMSQREIVRRRRANVLFVLAATVVLTGFLAATTHAAAMVWAFGLSFVVSSMYAYRLADLNRRRTEVDHTFGYQMPWLQHPHQAHSDRY